MRLQVVDTGFGKEEKDNEQSSSVEKAFTKKD
jgi:hypothetical protein